MMTRKTVLLLIGLVIIIIGVLFIVDKITKSSIIKYCGNGICEDGEGWISCKEDCLASIEECSDIRSELHQQIQLDQLDYCEVDNDCILSNSCLN